MLHQSLYIGERVFNRRKFRKDPDTGRRTSILNPQSEWIREQAPKLRIPDDDLWMTVQSKFGEVLDKPGHLTRRPKRALSGLIRCAVCGGPMVLNGEKYTCASHRERGACSNSKIIAAKTIETRVVDGVKKRLLAPEVIAEAVRAYRIDEEAKRLSALRDRSKIERELRDPASH